MSWPENLPLKAKILSQMFIFAATGPDGEQHVFIVRALLGRPYVCRKALQYQRPPCFHCEKTDCKTHSEFFDSVIGMSNGDGRNLLFREFITYDKDRCYPEYLVKYDRIQ